MKNVWTLATLAQCSEPLKAIKLAEDLSEFPSLLFRFADHLETLDLSSNLLSELPADFARFRRLKRLFLTANCFRSIPAVLRDCPALTMISFKGNQLEQFAEGVLPTSVDWLILTDNKLTSLPEDMGRYRQLKKLALSANQLSQLPTSMQECTELGLLRLALNRFTAFPDWLFQLPKLAWLAIGGNPACPVPSAQHEALPRCALADFHQLQKIGEGASGVIYQAIFQPHQSSAGQEFGMLREGQSIALKQFKGWITSDGCPKEELHNYINAGAHSNLIPVLAMVTEQDLPGLVMQLVPADFRVLGQPPSFDSITRDTFTQDQQMELPRLQHLWLQVKSVLQHLHQQQIAHGDLYAHNMLVNPQGQLYLGDFGAATALDHLPVHQRQAFLSIEIRALGYWLLDMISLLPQQIEPVQLEFWQSLASCCLQSNNLQQLAWLVPECE